MPSLSKIKSRRVETVRHALMVGLAEICQSPARDTERVSDSPIRVLLLEQIHPDAEALFRDAGYTVETKTRAWMKTELIRGAHGVQLLGIRSKTQVTARVLEAATDLEVIGAFCIGTNQIDLAAAARRGIAVFNAPFSNTRSVVELALAEISR